MKNFRDYLKESEQAADTPVAGDTFAINIREECLIESVVVESRDDGVVIAADEGMMRLLESYGYTFEENCMECGMMECGCGQDPEQYGDETDAGQDPGEYDYEGDMAKDELATMIRSARRLIGLLDNDDNMPEWTQKKINKATDYVDTAADYISSKKERGVMEQSEDLSLQDLIKKHRELVRSYNHELRMNDNTHFPYMDEMRDRLKKMWELIQAKKAAGQQSVTEQSQEPSPVARATLHRIMMRHPGMLAQHGPERVMAAVDDVADLVGDMDDIGTSDISGWVNMVQEILDSQDQGVAEGAEQQLTVQQLATISDEALDQAYGYGRSTPGNSFGWQANLMSAAYAKKLIDAGVTDIEKISDAIHKGWNVTAQKFVQNPEQFDDTEKLRQAGKLDAKLQQRAKLMKINYAQLDNEEQEKDRVVARALLQAIKGQQGVAEAEYQGRKVPLGKPMKGDVAKSKVYVRDPKTGNVKKVNFGDPNMRIKKSNPERRKSFRARHNCDNPGPRTSARYWSCRAW